MSEISKHTKYMLYASMVIVPIFGAINTLSFKYMDQTTVNGLLFKHPFF